MKEKDTETLQAPHIRTYRCTVCGENALSTWFDPEVRGQRCVDAKTCEALKEDTK